MNYGENISGAFRISLRNPYLWFFGFFVGGSTFNVTLSGQNENFGPSQGLQQFFEDNLVTLAIVGVVLAVVLTVVFIALSIISQAGLVSGVAALREEQSNSFSSTWRAGASKFWRMLGLQISLFLIGVLLFFVASIPGGLVALLVLAISDSVGLSILLIVLAALVTVVLLFLLLVPFSIIGALATRDLVLGDGGVFGSIGSGYDLFRDNIGKSLLVWLIQVGLSIAIGIVLGLITFGVGFLSSSLLNPLLEGFSLGDILLVGSVLFVFSLPFLILGAAIGTFVHAYWTHAYLQLRGESSNLSTTENG